MPLPRGYLSHSQIRLYIECPRKYEFSYVLETPAPVNERVFLGTVFHSALEVYFNSRLQNAPLELPDLLDAYQDLFRRLQEDREIDWQSPLRTVNERGEAFLRHFHKHLAPTLRPLMTERELDADIPGTGIRLKGVIDLVEEDHTITDFKTTSCRWTPSRANSSFQMVIYKYLYEREFGPVSRGLKYEIFYAKGSGPIRHQTLPALCREEETDKMLRAAQLVASGIEGGKFPANAGHFCRFCEFFRLCQRGRP